MSVEKECRTCKRMLPAAEFWTDRSRPDGKAARCRACSSTVNANWQEADIAKARRLWREASRRAYSAVAHRLRRHGLTEPGYEAMLQFQGNRCAICLTPEPDCIDHCHDSGRVRGLLCGPCNKALGFLRDSPENVDRALQYLRRTDDFRV